MLCDLVDNVSMYATKFVPNHPNPTMVMVIRAVRNDPSNTIDIRRSTSIGSILVL